MEKPDNHGFVNINWPSKSVPHGGIFHTRVVEPSAAQKEFLKVLLQESKLTISQRRKTALTLRKEENKVETKSSLAPLVRPRTSRRRSLSAIRESEALYIDNYRPLKRGEDREKLKEKFANTMTYGDTEQKPPISSPTKVRPKLPTKKEQWNELVTQVRERAEWLAEMEDLGHAGPHRELIKDQIAERLRVMDALGVDSLCSSARSTASGFSVIPSEHSSHSSSVQATQLKEIHASQSGQKLKVNKHAPKHKQEENVAVYAKLSPLQYSPRRRV